jgi:hypothetical protein
MGRFKKMTDEEIENRQSELVRVEDIEEFAGLPLETEAVFVNRLNDTKLKALARLPKLKRLITDGSSQVSDEGLRVLGGISSLEELDLEWSDSITDAGLAHLHGLANLRWLDVGFCGGLTERGISQLRETLKGCEVVA